MRNHISKQSSSLLQNLRILHLSFVEVGMNHTGNTIMRYENIGLIGISLVSINMGCSWNS